MKTHLLSALVLGGAIATCETAKAADPITYFGTAVVTAATSACVAAKWTIGRAINVNLREATNPTTTRTALRFSDGGFTIVATQRPGTSWSSPSGATYDAEISGLDVNPAVNYTGKATLQLFTSTSVPNARFMASGAFTNWAKVANCTLTVRATLIKRTVALSSSL
jgi:hypothetical protein